jgi:carbonic anhydrase
MVTSILMGNMSNIQQLLANNQAWAAAMTNDDPAFFQRLTLQQTPGYLWIGCSDSRVPATQLVGLLPGDMFVHRNIANVIVHTDLNCLSVLHYAVDVLHVQHIIVCGHYGCGGIQAALSMRKFGLIDNWLRHVQDVGHKHAALLAACQDEAHQLNRLSALNVIEQVVHACQTTIVQDAWDRRQPLAVHGWIYSVEDGLLRDLHICVTDPDELATQYARAIAVTP